jgi:hypothetical protein
MLGEVPSNPIPQPISFAGTLPDMPVSLVTLSASNNHFSGQIPASVGASPNLRTLKLGNNQLLGTVPSGEEACARLLGRGCGREDIFAHM